MMNLKKNSKMVEKYKGGLSFLNSFSAANAEEIVRRLLANQEAQGNPRNIEVFEVDPAASVEKGAFNWTTSAEGTLFWTDILTVNDESVCADKFNTPEIKDKPLLVEKTDETNTSIKLAEKLKYGVFTSLPSFTISSKFFNDKDIQVWKTDFDITPGEYIYVREYDTEKDQYTGNISVRRVTNILYGPNFGIDQDTVIITAQ